MHARKDARTVPVGRECIQVARPGQHRVTDIPFDRDCGAECHHQARPASEQQHGGIREWRTLLPGGQVGQRTQRDQLNECVNQRYHHDHREQRKWHVTTRIPELTRGRGRVLETRVCEEQQQRGLSEARRIGRGHREHARPVDCEDTDCNEHNQRQDLRDRETYREPCAVLHTDDVDPGKKQQRYRDQQHARRAASRSRRYERARLREAVRQTGDRCDTGEPRHPAHFETDEITECFARVDVAAAGLIEMTARFREAQHEQQHGKTREHDGPHARGTE